MNEAVSLAPNFIAAAVDTVDSHVAQLAADGIDVDTRARSALHLLTKLTAPQTLGALESLLAHVGSLAQVADAGALSAPAQDVLTRAAAAFGQSATTRHARVGAFGAMRALSDPDLQRAIGFLLAFGRALGRNLDAPAQLTTSAANGEERS